MKRPALVAMIVVVLATLGCRLWGRLFAGAYLAAWWFWMGTALGAQANVWLHDLTGGRWGEAVRDPLLRLARTGLIAAPLFLPVLFSMRELYPWVADAGGARWAGELSAPALKRWWLMPDAFVARSIGYLLLWSFLIWLADRPGFRRSKSYAAAGLILYGFSAGLLASVDWLMSLTPLWYSSVFGWLVCTGQMLAGLAYGVAVAARRPSQLAASIFGDLGNLLLMYVMTWAYLAFSEFLIIWAENLPHEILWYLARSHGAWLGLGWLLVIFFFAAPLLILLSRHAKQTAAKLRLLAVGLLAMQFLNCCWLILPSIPLAPMQWLWSVPPCLLATGVVLYATQVWRAEPPAEGTAHA